MTQLEKIIKGPAVIKGTRGFYNADAAASASDLIAKLLKASSDLNDLNGQLNSSTDWFNVYVGKVNDYKNQVPVDNVNWDKYAKLRDAEGVKIDSLKTAIANKKSELASLQAAIDSAVKTDPALVKAAAEAKATSDAAKTQSDIVIAKSKDSAFNMKIIAIVGGITIVLIGIGYAIHLIRKP